MSPPTSYLAPADMTGQVVSVQQSASVPTSIVIWLTKSTTLYATHLSWMEYCRYCRYLDIFVVDMLSPTRWGPLRRAAWRLVAGCPSPGSQPRAFKYIFGRNFNLMMSQDNTSSGQLDAARQEHSSSVWMFWMLDCLRRNSFWYFILSFEGRLLLKFSNHILNMKCHRTKDQFTMLNCWCSILFYFCHIGAK